MTEHTVDFRMAFEALPGNFIVLQPDSPNYTILAINDQLLGITGRERREVTGRSIFEAFPYNSEASGATGVSDLRASLDKVVHTKKGDKMPVVRYEVFDKVNGFVERYWSTINKPMLNAQGELLYIVHSTVDVTAKIRAEKSVVNEIENSYNFFVQAPVAICIVKGPDYIVELANESMLQFIGRTAEIAGKPIRETLTEATEQGLIGILDFIRHTGEPYYAYGFPATILINGIREQRYFDLVFKPYFQNPVDIEVTHIFCVAHNVTEQVLARKKVEESEQRTRSFIESVPFPIGIYYGREMRIQFANKSILDVWGKGYDVIGKLYADILPELDNQEIFKQLDSVFTTGIPFHAENQRVDLMVDGGLRPYYFNYNLTPLYDTEGSIYGVMNTGADVTDLNLAHRKIKESEQNLLNIILQAPVAMCILRGPQYVVEIANERLFELLGKPAEALLHRPLFDGLPEAKKQGFEELLDNVYTTGETFSAYGLPVTLPRNGKIEVVYVNFVYEAFREGDGTVSGVMAVATDVTEQVIATKKIEEAEERARLAIESALLGTYEINLITNDIISSARMAAIFNVENTADRNRYITAIHPEDLKLRDDAFKKAYETSYLSYDTRVVHKDGSMHWVRVKGRVYYDQQNRPVRLLGVVQDITEPKEFAEALRKKVEERTMELAEANEHLAFMNKELEQFTYAASHDMQEPLRKVQTFSSLLLKNHTGQLDERGKNIVLKIGNSAQRMQTMVDDLLNYSHQVREAHKFIPTDLNQIIIDVETDLELTIQQKQATITKEVLPQITAVPSQMNQLFFNLFSNSLKFSKPGIPARIDITLASPSAKDLSVAGISAEYSYIKIIFSDNGIGFEQQYAEQIFSLFKRLHGRSEYEGTGIGLGLCKKIVQNHHGAIWAESEPGKGAAFHMLLPFDLSTDD